MKQVIASCFFYVSFFLLSSCQKVIKVNLNSSNPQYVIEGNVSNDAPPYHVRITKTINFSDANGNPSVANASVIISDNGVPDTLIYAGNGYYQTQNLVGTPGHLYSIAVHVDGETFSSADSMPEAVYFDSLYVTENDFLGQLLKAPVPVYKDPAGIKNYYHFLTYRNGYVSKKIYYKEDLLTDGLEVHESLLDQDSTYKTGDILRVDMQCISQPAYQYYYSLAQTQSGQSGAPANPVSNIIGTGGIGYFSAYAVQTKQIIVP